MGETTMRFGKVMLRWVKGAKRCGISWGMLSPGRQPRSLENFVQAELALSWNLLKEMRASGIRRRA